MISINKTPEFDTALQCVGCFIEYGGKILFLGRNENKSEGGKYGIPGGKIDEVDDRSSANAIIREVFEETGIVISSQDLISSAVFYVEYDGGRRIVYNTYKTILREQPGITLRENEHQDFVWKSPEEALLLPLMIHGDDTIKHVYNIE